MSFTQRDQRGKWIFHLKTMASKENMSTKHPYAFICHGFLRENKCICPVPLHSQIKSSAENELAIGGGIPSCSGEVHGKDEARDYWDNLAPNKKMTHAGRGCWDSAIPVLHIPSAVWTGPKVSKFFKTMNHLTWNTMKALIVLLKFDLRVCRQEETSHSIVCKGNA